MSKYGFYLDMLGLESKVRGIYLSVATECEFFMDRTIAKCEESDPTKRETLKLKLPLEMGGKLERCIAALTLYNHDYYTTYKSIFDEIAELSIYRNMLAHGYAKFDIHEKDTSFMDIVWIEKFKNTPRVRKSKTIVIKPFLKGFLKYRQTVFKFWELDKLLIQERGEE